MKLYYYEHCPFSTKVRMVLGLKRLDIEQQVLLYDDEVTPQRLVGKKAVPILVKDDGLAMSESLMIVRYLDHLSGGLLIAETQSQPLMAWIESIMESYQVLGYPRWARIGLKELASPEAHALFVHKKSRIIGDFNAALIRSEVVMGAMKPQFRLLTEMCDPPAIDPGRRQSVSHPAWLQCRGWSKLAGLGTSLC
ncbi:glutaredoxin 2 [Pseudomonas duriflava]|uniref:Glutaredoxin 2 n=1 Tax=Pseudomonas duriflava TaxID=459528 RepID=A0A562QGZ7_9PSED|nr:glutaredoxin 2 [Pseudomonas duriflava]TWI55460.1 glutaredoxin 2 [Pseudomonas duriflava]